MRVFTIIDFATPRAKAQSHRRGSGENITKKAQARTRKSVRSALRSGRERKSGATYPSRQPKVGPPKSARKISVSRLPGARPRFSAKIGLKPTSDAVAKRQPWARKCAIAAVHTSASRRLSADATKPTVWRRYIVHGNRATPAANDISRRINALTRLRPGCRSGRASGAESARG